MEKKKTNCYIILYSGLISLMNVTGCYLSVKYDTSIYSKTLVDLFRKLPFWGYVVYFVCSFVFLMLLSSLFLKANIKNAVRRESFIPFRFVVLIFIGLIICWIPVLLAVFPGFFNYDIEGQLPQVMYHTGYITHHSLLSTLIMGTLITAGYHLFSENIVMGIFCYSVFQMIVCSLVFTVCICYLYKITCSKTMAALAFAYYAFFPIISMFALSTTKDVICSCFLLLSALLIYDLWTTNTENVNDKFRIRFKKISLVASLILMCLMRKNGIIAVVLFGIALFLFGKKEKRYIGMIIVSVIGYFVIAVALKSGLHAKSGGSVEAFSVPIQQISRVYIDKGKDAFSEEEWDLISKIVSEERLSQYNPFLADDIKNFLMFQEVERAPLDYAKLWIMVGIRNPKEYLEAFGDMTYQAWYPWTLIVEDPNTGEVDFFDFDMSLDIDRISVLPRLCNQLELLSKTDKFQRFPFIRLFFSIGFMLWVAITQLFIGLVTKKKEIVWPVVVVLAYCFSSIMGPESLVRYYLILFYYFPLAIAFICKAFCREHD